MEKNDPFQDYHLQEAEERFTRYREPSRKQQLHASSGKASSGPMVGSSIHRMNPMDRGHSREQRDWVVNELEKIFRNYGNPVRKGSLEMESQLYDKSRNQEEYLALAQRLLRHMRDLAKRRQVTPSSQDSDPFCERLPVTPGLSPSADLRSSSTVFPYPVITEPQNPAVYPIPPTATRYATASSLEELPVPSDIHYGTVRLPAPNKRTFAAATVGPYRTSPLHRSPSDLDRVNRLDNVPEIVTRLVREEGQEGQEENVPLSSDTYEVSFKILVPRNAVIKQMTIHVKKIR